MYSGRYGGNNVVQWGYCKSPSGFQALGFLYQNGGSQYLVSNSQNLWPFATPDARAQNHRDRLLMLLEDEDFQIPADNIIGAEQGDNAVFDAIKAEAMKGCVGETLNMAHAECDPILEQEAGDDIAAAGHKVLYEDCMFDTCASAQMGTELLPGETLAQASVAQDSKNYIATPEYFRKNDGALGKCPKVDDRLWNLITSVTGGNLGVKDEKGATTLTLRTEEDLLLPPCLGADPPTCDICTRITERNIMVGEECEHTTIRAPRGTEDMSGCGQHRLAMGKTAAERRKINFIQKAISDTPKGWLGGKYDKDTTKWLWDDDTEVLDDDGAPIQIEADATTRFLCMERETGNLVRCCDILEDGTCGFAEGDSPTKFDPICETKFLRVCEKPPDQYCSEPGMLASDIEEQIDNRKAWNKIGDSDEIQRKVTAAAAEAETDWKTEQTTKAAAAATNAQKGRQASDIAAPSQKKRGKGGKGKRKGGKGKHKKARLPHQR